MRIASRRLVIFDCDGVLVDSEELSNAELARLVAGFGGNLTAGELRTRYAGWTLPNIGNDLSEHFGLPVPSDWIEQFETARDAAFRNELRAIDGAVDAVRAIIENAFTVCVASQARIEKTELTLGVIGLWDVFRSRAFSSRSVQRPKPAPDLFLHAAAAMGFPPARCAVVEDTVLGMEGGVAAGMTVFGFVPESQPVAAEVTPFHSMAMLPELLVRWRSS